MTRLRVWPILVLAAALPLVAAARLAADELGADEVVRRSIAAQGGQESWDALRSLIVKGSFSTFSAENPFTLYLERPAHYRFEHKYGDFDMTYGFDGQIAWWSTTAFYSEASWPIEVPLHYRTQIAGDAIFGGPLLDHDERGHGIELIGRTDLDGEGVFEIQVTLANGSQETWYLDAETFLPAARVSPGADIDRPLERWSYFSDYREVAGVRMAHRIEIEMGSRFQLMEIDEVEANAEIDGALFALPIPEAVDRLRTLAGEWSVEVATRLLPTLPWIAGETTSTIRSVHHGHLLSEEIFYVAAGSPRHVRRWYSHDRFRDVYRVTYFDSLTSHVNVLEGRFEDGRLVVTNLDSGTTWTSRGQTVHNRQVLYDIEPDAFKVDWDISIDGGKTWMTRAQLVYRRSE